MRKQSKKQKVSTKALAITIVSILTVAVITALCIIFSDQLFAIFGKVDHLKEFIRSAGAFGPVVFVLLQILQVVVAPIPGQVVGVVGGYLFGWWGLALSIIGNLAGCFIIFILARRFGRPLAEKLFKPETIKKFDYVTESKGAFILFLIFILPFFPDDVICYLAGLTKVPINKLMLASFAGRVPGFLMMTLAGSGLESGSLNALISICVGTLLLMAICWWQRDWLGRFVKSKNRLEFIKQNWQLTLWQTIATGALAILAFVLLCVFALWEF
ncbi:MAG: TVP38/TMEM64 family protein [Candidatus Nomurabacteria bacterium]|jgi:uncharacterized membrane protein YdjX (TVP38/TMEM64 family)|nr:TVP38/TMEM64 family protein [Candidatus Nomurabacteria bacterium]